MSCDVGEVMERLENEQRHHCLFHRNGGGGSTNAINIIIEREGKHIFCLSWKFCLKLFLIDCICCSVYNNFYLIRKNHLQINLPLGPFPSGLPNWNSVCIFFHMCYMSCPSQSPVRVGGCSHLQVHGTYLQIHSVHGTSSRRAGSWATPFGCVRIRVGFSVVCG